MNEDAIIRRISKHVGVEDIVGKLGYEISWSDLQSLFLHVVEKRMQTITATDVMANYRGNRFTAAAKVDPRLLLEIDRALYHIIPDSYQAIELSPVVPAGSSSKLTSLNSKVTLSTVRNVEVVSDPSTALALECAKQMMEGREKVDLATSHRTLRLQAFPPTSGFSAHFKAFVLASSAKDQGHNAFELEALRQHLSVWLQAVTSAESLGICAKSVTVSLSDVMIMEKLIQAGKIDRTEARRRTQDATYHPFAQHHIDLPARLDTLESAAIENALLAPHLHVLADAESRIIEPLRDNFPDVSFDFDLERCAGIGYYCGPCFKIKATNTRGESYPLADGGMSDWLWGLTGNKKNRIVTSGFGTELFCRLFKC
jgi:hypothetical protein